MNRAPSLDKTESSNLSRLVLGTVQFGLDYGIANRDGRPGYSAVVDILQAAYEGGVNGLDTAAGYGESEEVLGRALEELALKEKMKVITKIAALPDGLSQTEAARRIEASVGVSLKRLRIECLPVCLFHREENLDYVDALIALRARGLIGAAGVSLISPTGARRALGIAGLDVWQIPSNVLDHRFLASGIATTARAQGIVLLVRSVYLQGLLLLEDTSTPVHLAEVKAPRRLLRSLAARHNLALNELLLRAMLAHSEIQSLVIGVETLSQLRDNFALFAKGPLPAPILAELAALSIAVSDFLVNPPAWKS